MRCASVSLSVSVVRAHVRRSPAKSNQRTPRSGRRTHIHKHIHLHIRILIHIRIHTYTYTYTYTHTHTDTHTHNTQTHSHTYTNTYTYTYTYTHTYTHTHTQLHIHSYTYTYTYTHTYTRTHTFVHLSSCLSPTVESTASSQQVEVPEMPIQEGVDQEAEEVALLPTQKHLLSHAPRLRQHLYLNADPLR